MSKQTICFPTTELNDDVKLINACVNGDANVVDYLLNKRSADLTVFDMSGHNPLMIACIRDYIKIVELLLLHGADPNTPNRKGYTALMFASLYGYKKIVEMLLGTNKVDINAVNRKGYTALMFACQNGHTSTVEVLVSKGADMNVIAKNGVTALMIAYEEGHEKIMDLLYKNGANPKLLFGKNVGPLAQTSAPHPTGLEALVRDRCSSTGLKSVKTQAIIDACKTGQTKVVQALLNSGADPNITNAEGDTPLAFAVLNGHTETVELLLSLPVKSVNVASKNKYVPLMCACQMGYTKIVELLVWNGANVNFANIHGQTSLMLACINGHTEIVRVLLNNGANVNIAAGNGDTALMTSCYHGHIEIVKLLLANKADKKAVDIDGKTAVMLASENKHEDIVSLLDEKVASTDKPESVSQDCTVKTQVNLVDSDGYSALMYACKNAGRTEIVKALLSSGANPNFKNKKGQTALMLAAVNGHTETVKLLLEHC